MLTAKPIQVSIDEALKVGKRVRIGHNPSMDPHNTYYGYAIEVEGGTDVRWGSQDDDEFGVLIFVPGTELESFEKDADD
jgi:hypothetical protein